MVRDGTGSDSLRIGLGRDILTLVISCVAYLFTPLHDMVTLGITVR